MSKASARLEREYGGKLGPGLAALTQEQQAALADAIEATRERQARALKAATSEGLKFVPALLRPAIKKVLFG